MALRSRTRLQLRRAVMTAALGALVVPATAGAAVKLPTITKVTPASASVGQTLTVYGKHFRRGRGTNTVLFKRDGGKALFVKAGLATTKQLAVVVPKNLEKYMDVQASVPQAARFRLRVLTTRLGRDYTSPKLSPVIGPEVKTAVGPGGGAAASVDPAALLPDGDCDGDGLTNAFEDTVLKTKPCVADSDGDGVTDGYEYASAIDLNSDDYRYPAISLPYPGKRPYPNPLDGTDANTDFDGDSLTLGEEYRLWRYTIAHGAVSTLQSLTYSDGLKYSVYTRTANGRRVGTLAAAGYDKAVDFTNWLNASGYNTVRWPDAPDTPYNFFDVNRNGIVDGAGRSGYFHSETDYLDTHGSSIGSAPDGVLSDDERDEDADGLSNYAESHGAMLNTYFTLLYTKETAFPIKYAGTQIDDPDSDGDGIRDGADDQDHDDVPNFAELSRNMISGRHKDSPSTTVADAMLQHLETPADGRVNPYNPCLPFSNGRSCPTYIPFDGAWAPFDGPPWNSEGTDPDYLVLN